MDMLDRDLRACRSGRSLGGVLQLAAILAGHDDEGKWSMLLVGLLSRI